MASNSNIKDNVVESAYARLEASIRSYSREKMGLEANIQSLKRELGELQKEIDSKNQMINSLTFEKDTLVQEREEDEKARIAVEALVQNFDSKFQIFLDMLGSTNTLLDDMKDRCGKLENNNTGIKRAHLKLFAYCSELESSNNEIGKQFQAKCNEAVNISEKLHRTVERFNALQSEYTALQSLKAETDAKVVEHEKTIGELKDEMEKKTKVIQTLSTELEQGTEQLLKLKLDLDGLQNSLNVSTGKVGELHESLQLMTQEKENLALEKEKVHQAAVEEKEALVIEHGKAIEELRDELDKKLQVNQTLSGELERTAKRLCTLEHEYAELQESLTVYDGKVTELHEALKVAAQEKENLSLEKDKALQAAAEENESLIVEHGKTLQELRDELDKKLQINQFLSSELEQATVQLSTLKLDLDELQSSLNVSNGKVGELQESLQLLTQEKENLILEKEKICHAALEEKEALVVEHKKTVEELRDELDKKLQINQTLSSELEQTTTRLSTLESEYNELQESLKVTYGKVTELDEAIQVANQEKGNLSLEKDKALQAAAEEKEQLVVEHGKTIQQLQDELEQKTAMYKMQLDECLAKQEKLAKELETVEGKYEYRQSRYDNLSKEYRRMYKEYQALEKEREKFEKEVKSKPGKKRSASSASPKSGQSSQTAGTSSSSCERETPSTSKYLKMSTSDTEPLTPTPLAPTTPKPTKKKSGSFRRTVPDPSVQPSRGILKSTSSENLAAGTSSQPPALTPTTSPHKGVSFSSPIYQDFHGLSSDSSTQSQSQSYP